MEDQMIAFPAAGDRGDRAGHRRGGRESLLYLLITGIAIFLGALTLAALRMRRRPGKHPVR